jgi:hypothetical protein
MEKTTKNPIGLITPISNPKNNKKKLNINIFFIYIQTINNGIEYYYI